MASLPSTIYLHLEALLLLVTEDMNSLHLTAWALEQQTHELPTKRVILVGLCGLHPMTIIHICGFHTTTDGSSVVSPGFYRDLILQGREQAGKAVTHMFVITRICIATNKRYILPEYALWRWLGKSVPS